MMLKNDWKREMENMKKQAEIEAIRKMNLERSEETLRKKKIFVNKWDKTLEIQGVKWFKTDAWENESFIKKKWIEEKHASVHLYLQSPAK